MNIQYILYGSIIVVGWMLLYEVIKGQAVVNGTRRITRKDNPFRYWFWVVFHAAVLAVLLFALTLDLK